jgi:hypothetical protein
MFEGKNGEFMTKMYYVRFFIMLMTIKMLQGGVFKS